MLRSPGRSGTISEELGDVKVKLFLEKTIIIIIIRHWCQLCIVGGASDVMREGRGMITFFLDFFFS